MAVRAREPRDAIAALEAHPIVAAGEGDRFAGYAVPGVAFPSGDLLALRRFPSSSLGPAYTSVWHRDRLGRWTFFQDVVPALGCARYFEGGVDRTVVAPIRILWTGGRAFTVLVDGGRMLEWSVTLDAGPVTRALSRVAAVFSRWRTPPSIVTAILSRAAQVALGAGAIRLTSRTPAGYRFTAYPSALWTVAASRAVIGRRDTGDAINLVSDVRLGDFRIPRIGLFLVARARMTA